MQVKMKVHYNDTSGHNFEPNQIVEVGSGLGVWLIAEKKAEEVVTAGSIHDVEPQFENANEPPKQDVMTSQPVKKPRRGK